MILVTQSFGKENEYRRAILAIWSYWRFDVKAKVILFTDLPTYFETYFAGMPVEYNLLTPTKMQAMRGQIDFLHRMKIALIDEAFIQTDDDLLYIDSDTFFINNPVTIEKKLTEKDAFMHLREYRFDLLREMKLPAAKPFHDFLNLIESDKFVDSEGRQINVSADQYSWNAGVMAFHKTHKRLLPDVYVLTDQFYPSTMNHACEQYAFSIILQNNTNLMPCDLICYHYWYRVKKAIVDELLRKVLTLTWSQRHISDKLKSINSLVGKLPSLMDSHILTLRDNSIQAFHTREFQRGYYWALCAMLKQPFNLKFIRDVLYHTKRYFISE